MSEEIKLGWYRSKNTNALLYHALGFRTDSTAYKVVGYWDGSHIQAMRKQTLLEDFDYIGTELGEWVDPDDVKLSELPIRARFRDIDGTEWFTGILDGILVLKDDPLKYSMVSGAWYAQCQVWRAKK